MSLSRGKRIPVLPQVDLLKPGERRTITSSSTGRSIVLIRNPRAGERPLFFCMDALCYHMGGSLGASGEILDLEELGVVIKCPEHNHILSLHNGGVVQQGNCAPVNKHFREPECRRQRTHRVEIEANGSVWAIVDSEEGEFASDKYNITVRPRRQHNKRSLGRSITLESAPVRKRQSNPFMQFRARKMHATAAIKRKLEAKANTVPEQKVGSRGNTLPEMFSAMSAHRALSFGNPKAPSAEPPQERRQQMTAEEYFRTFRHAA